MLMCEQAHASLHTTLFVARLLTIQQMRSLLNSNEWCYHLCSTQSGNEEYSLSIYEKYMLIILWDNPTDSKYTVSRITGEWSYKNHCENAE